MAAYDLYGFESRELDEIATRLSETLSITWGLHESSYRGGDYYGFGSPGHEEFILQRNLELDDELMEPEFSKYPILLYVARTERSEELADLILKSMGDQAALLRHDVL
jgi:hypothetical protein